MDEIIQDRSSDELRHHGIKGMRWGIRRYQNKDGSLTPAGRKRYDQEIESLKSEKAKLQQKHKNLNAQQRMEDRKAKLKAEIESEKEYLKNGGKKSGKNDSSDNKSEETKEPEKKKSASDMTSEELNEAINHMRLQQTYNQLYSQLNPEKESKVKEIGKKFLDQAIIPAGTSVAKDWLTKVGKEALGIDAKEAKSEYDKLKDQYNILKTKKDIEDLKNPKSEYDKLKDEYNILKTKKDIEDLKNPKKDYGKENDELRSKLENEKLKDEEYQDLKTRSEKASFKRNINNAERMNNNNNNNNSNSASSTDSQKKTGEDYTKKSSYSLMPYESTKNSSDYKSNVDSGSVWVVDKYGEVEIKNGYKED